MKENNLTEQDLKEGEWLHGNDGKCPGYTPPPLPDGEPEPDGRYAPNRGTGHLVVAPESRWR